VNGHVQRVREKLQVHTAPAAVAEAIREQLV
jgi:DNA-binding CsgD family transcriptional regulator